MPPLNWIIYISLELYRRSWECFAKREQQSDWGTVQWPDENATRGVVGPCPQRCPWSQWSRILDFGRAFEVCLSETWQRLQATGQRRQELMFKPSLHLWIGMDSFFFVQGTMNFLFHTLPSNSFTWLLPRFMERFGLLPAYTYCPKQQENKWHSTVYNHLLFTII